MSSATVESCHLPTKGPPDFSFPPTYTYNEEITASILPEFLPRTPPNLGFPLHPMIRNPTPTPTELPEIMTPLTPLSASPFQQPVSRKSSIFLAIPLEIRLQIYEYVLLSHPIQHAHLSPITNPNNPWAGAQKQEFHTTMLRPLGVSYPQFTTYSSSTITTTSTPRVGSSPRTQGKIPAGLLSSCRQVYSETKMIPWESNQFAFVNWFWSGVYAARQFTRGLRPWQSEGLRWCTVEVLGRDLWVDGMERIGGAVGGTSTGAAGGKDGKGVGEWRELCGFWRGVWGLRLRVKGSVVSERKDEIEVSAQRGWNGEDGAWSADEAEKKDGQKEESILDVEGVWVSDGLARMKSVRWIELEIEDEAVERDVKLTFCAQLEEKLTAWRSQENGWEGKVQVIFVEKVKIPPVPNKNFVWYGGEPGDESIWGLDM